MDVLGMLGRLRMAESEVENARQDLVMAVIEEVVGIGSWGVSPAVAQEVARRFVHGSIAPWYEALPTSGRERVLQRLESLGEKIERW